jgi:hypothetical protein
VLVRLCQSISLRNVCPETVSYCGEIGAVRRLVERRIYCHGLLETAACESVDMQMVSNVWHEIIVLTSVESAMELTMNQISDSH